MFKPRWVVFLWGGAESSHVDQQIQDIGVQEKMVEDTLNGLLVNKKNWRKPMVLLLKNVSSAYVHMFLVEALYVCMKS